MVILISDPIIANVATMTTTKGKQTKSHPIVLLLIAVNESSSNDKAKQSHRATRRDPRYRSVFPTENAQGYTRNKGVGVVKPFVFGVEAREL